MSGKDPLGGMAAAAAAAGKSAPKPTSKGDGKWIQIQKRTFTNWVELRIGRDIDIVEEEFKDGVPLIELLESCSGKAFGKYCKKPKNKHQELENLGAAIRFMNAEGLKLVNIGPEDLNQGNEKLVLGLLWTIIYHWQVSSSFKAVGKEVLPVSAKKGGAKDLLLEWVRSKIPEYDIKNFTSDWRDGRAVCGLTNAVGGDPYLIPDHFKMPPGAATSNAKKGIDTAADNLNVPKLITPEDLCDPACDELSVITYLSCFRSAQRKGGLANIDGPGPGCCQHPSGCSSAKKEGSDFCPIHGGCQHTGGCTSPSQAHSNYCKEHSACEHPSGCKDEKKDGSAFCATHAACQHPSGCKSDAVNGGKFCAAHTCQHSGCSDATDGGNFCPAHSPAASSGKRVDANGVPISKDGLPPPHKRAADWRVYEGDDLGGRCKIRVYYSTTTSSLQIRKNTQAMQMLLEREKVHLRPDFEPMIPIDIDMTKENRDKIFNKAGQRITPMLFVDDEFVGDYDVVCELNETDALHNILRY